MELVCFSQVFYIYLTAVSILFVLSACACLRKRTCHEHPVTSSLSRREAPSAEAEMSLVGKSASRVRLAVEHESHVGSFFLRLGVIGETLSSYRYSVCT